MADADSRSMLRALIPIYGITLIDVFGYMIMIPLLPYVAQRFGASGLTVGALLATMAVASTVAAPIWGALSDRIGRKPIVVISQVIALIGYLLLAWAPSLAMLFVARGVAGIGGGNLGVTQSYIADVTDKEHRDKAYAAFGVVFGIGIVLGPVTGGILIRFGAWVPFLAAAAIEIANIALTLRFLPATKPRAQRGLALADTARFVARTPGVRSLIVRHFLFIFAVTYFFTVFALYVKKALGLGPQTASWLIAGMGLSGGIFLAIAVGRLTRRFGDAAIAQAGLALSALAYAMLAFPRSIWPFAAVLVVWAAGASCVEPTLSALLSESAPRAQRGAVMGFNDATSNLALMLAPALGGWVIDVRRDLIGVIPAVAVMAAFSIGALRRTEDRTTERIRSETARG